MRMKMGAYRNTNTSAIKMRLPSRLLPFHSITACSSPSPKRFITTIHTTTMTIITKRDGRAQLGIVGAAQELLFDQVAQQHLGAAAQQTGDGEGGHGGDEHHGDAGEHPGQRQGQDDLAEHLDAAGAQVPGRLNQGVVQLYDARSRWAGS